MRRPLRAALLEEAPRLAVAAAPKVDRAPAVAALRLEVDRAPAVAGLRLEVVGALAIAPQ